MRLIGKRLLVKYQKKHAGNVTLCRKIDILIKELEMDWPSVDSFIQGRTDADEVHSDGLYFFDVFTHRTLILLEMDEEGEATVIWIGNHDDYERVFRNNKQTIQKWLKNRGYVV